MPKFDISWKSKTKRGIFQIRFTKNVKDARNYFNRLKKHDTKRIVRNFPKTAKIIKIRKTSTGKIVYKKKGISKKLDKSI